MESNPDFEYTQERLNFLKKIIPRDDVYEFVDIALQMTSVFCYYFPIEILKDYPLCQKSYQNVMEIRDKFLEQDVSPLEISKFELMK